MDKPIDFWQGYYVNRKGQIFSNKSKRFIALSDSCRTDYLSVSLRKKLGKRFISKTYQVHQLVAKAFIPNPELKGCVNHKNFDKHDNRVENLEWCTNNENNLHNLEKGINKDKMSKEQKKLIFDLHTKKDWNYKRIAGRFGLSREYIHNIIKTHVNPKY